MLANGGNPVEAESRRETRCRWQRKIPDFQSQRDVCFGFSVDLKSDIALVISRCCLRRHVHFDPDRLITAAGEIERERIALLFSVPVDPRDQSCLLYTSDAADERSSVDLGGRRI